MGKNMEFTGGPFGNEVADRAAAVRWAGGKVFYVNPNVGTGAEDRNTPFPEVDEEVCFSTHQGAIDACESDRGDLIIVARGYEPVTATVDFDCQGISMIPQTFGISPAHGAEYFCIDNSSTTTAAAEITSPCYIEGIGFHTNYVTATESHIVQIGTTTGNVWGVTMKNCRFTDWGTGCDIGLRFRGGTNCLIDSCSFEANASTDFTAGIQFWTSATNNPLNNQVRDCWFKYCAYAIVHRSSVNHQGLMYGPGNVTYESTTKFCNSNSGAGIGIIFGNHFMTAIDDATFDLTVNNMETAGIHCVGNYYKDENTGDAD